MLKAHKRMLRITVVIYVFFAWPLYVSAQEPLIPINTNFSHWDHHWIMWMPQHPIYEAIEILSADNPKRPESKLIRIFFTERAGGKKQVQYFSDASVARNWRGEAYHRDIEYRTEGVFGKPLGLYIKFKDKNDAWVEWTMQFESGQELTTEWEGQKGQGGHAADTVFLLFYNGPNATTIKSKLLIDGKDYSSQVEKGGGKKHYYHAAYSSNAYAAVISYGQSNFALKQNELSNSWGRVFKKVIESKSGGLYRSNSFGFQSSSQIEVEASLQAEIRTYRHRYGGHVFQIEFEPALPNIGSAKSGQSIRYKISLDNFKNLVEGILSVKKEANLILLDWQHQSPSSAKDYSFTSTVRPDSSGGYDLVVARKR